MKYISAWTLALRPVFSTRELDCYSMQDGVLLDLKLFFISPPLSGKKRIGLRCRYLGDSCFTSELHLTVSTFPSAQNQSRCDRILFGCHRGLWGFIRSSLAASKQASHFVYSSHFLCKCAVPELLTVTLAGPSPALLNRLQGGGQAELSAALGAHCLDKPGGLEAQLKLGQRGLASSLRW